jgi:hypothetical protein
VASRATSAAPALLGAAWLASLFAPILSPAKALANRDIALFHLPLRASFRELAAFGLPGWNPWLHGGQPVLSNPSYGSFYPPGWLVFAVPPHYALSLLAVLHGALAFAGAWRLARRLGCDRAAAALAAVGFAGCGAYLSLLSVFTILLGISWLPWVLAWGDEALRAAPGERWWRPALKAGGALGLVMLNGEPSAVVMGGLGLLALAVPAVRRRPAAAWRILLPAAFALALAAVQIVPTLGRLADSPRKALPAAYAATWSLPPERLAELAFPRFFGDPTRSDEGLFFGWRLNDLDYPYLESIYPGLLLAVLGISALLRGGIPRRSTWALAFAGGLLTALGRHTPVYEAVRHLPVLAALRFPERFAVLAVLALALAGVLGWQRLLDERDAGRPGAADFPLALSLVVLATALLLGLVLRFEPRAAGGFVAAHGAPGIAPEAQRAAAAYLGAESLAAIATAAAVAALLALCRWRRPSRRLLSGLAVALLAADLWHYGHGLLRAVPAAVYRVPPPLAAALARGQDRIWVQSAPSGVSQRLPRWGDPRTLFTRTYVARLEPYSGVLWHIPYAFHVDFDLMLTGWGRRAAGILDVEWAVPQMAYRYLGVWNVGTALLRRTSPEQVPAAPDPGGSALIRLRNAYVLPRFRFVPRVSFQPGWDEALAAARAEGWDVARHEQAARSGRPAETVAYRRRPALLEVVDEGGRVRLRYRAEEGAFFVAASTFDEGWSARVDGAPVPVYPTAACQLGVALPPGEHRLELAYRDPRVPLGAAVTLAALGAAGLALGRRARRSIP